MKKMKSLLFSPLLVLLALLWTGPRDFLTPQAAATKATAAAGNSACAVPLAASAHAGPTDNSDSIVAYAMGLLGSPYVYAGITPDGFDCSGFITHVYGKFDVAVPHSSALQAREGVQVAREEAREGDLVIFTGTNAEVREPGHVGIVISSPGDTIAFVHASSNGGVKVSKVKGTRYDIRFLQIRRIL